ncbi:DUF3618 domain-containing protein [Brachybacterium sp. DNPG3]
MAKKKSLDEMRDEAYRRQDNLAADIDELIDRVNPKNAAQRWKNEVVGSVRSFSDAGDGKSSATLAVAGGVIGVIVLGAGVAAALLLSGGKGDASAAKKTAKAAKKTTKKAAKAVKKTAKASRV